MKQGKWRTLAGIMTLFLVLMLCCCIKEGEKTGSQTQVNDEPASQTNEFSFLEEESSTKEERDPEESKPLGEDYQARTEVTYGEQAEAWNDNFLDDYHGVLLTPLKKIKVDGDLNGAGGTFVGEAGCMRHGLHVFSDYRKGWNGVNGITTDGREFEVKVVVDPERVGNQIHNIAPLSGKKGYVAEFYDGQPSNQWLYELDEDFQVIRSVHAKVEINQFFSRLMGDADGNFHVLYNAGAKTNYLIFSPEGEVIFEKEVSMISEFRAFAGGRVGLCERMSENDELRLSEAKLDAGTLEELAAFKDDAVKTQMADHVFDATGIDEYRIIWCSHEGITTYDATSKEVKVVYRWSNHGIVPKNISDLTVTADGSIELLLKDENEEGLFYLLLEPTKEKKELQSITFAVNQYNREKFEKAAAYFQKKYPGYVINVKNDYDATGLLTQLGAGEGPVLVDVSLTGFEEMEKLWQPLDGFLEQAGLKNEIIPETLELGKINGVTYGIVRDFQIDTLLVSDQGINDWDYEGFLDAVEGFGGALLTYRYIDSPSDWREEFFDMLKNGLADNYYFNAGTGEMIFGTQKFDRILSLSQKATKCPSYEEGKALREGTVLCEIDTEFTVDTLIRLRRRLEENGERAIGYPTKDGAGHRLVAISPIAIRKTASEEEKEIAYTFLKVYLSEEAMEASGGFLPVRKDVLEARLKAYQETVDASKSTGSYNPNYMPDLDWDKDVKFIEELIHNSIPQRDFPVGLEKIFDEEFTDYLDGRIDGKVLDDHLKSRVWLYLEENK